MSGRAGRSTPAVHPEVQVPGSLNEALQVLKRDPEIPLWAGGTWWMDQKKECSRLLALHAIPELKRVVRSDVRVDVGAAVAVARLREVGGHFLNPALLAAIDQLGPPPVRNLATLGGALCLPDGYLPVAVVLLLLDARAEIRRQGHSRWVPINKIAVAPGELLTRLRVPLRAKSHWMLHRFGFPYPPGSSSLTVAATAVVEKGALEELHYAMLLNGKHLIRFREAESELVGRQLPLTERDLRVMIGALEQHPNYGSDMDNLGRWRAASTLRQFLRTLG